MQRLTSSRFLGALGRTSRGSCSADWTSPSTTSPDEVDLETAMRSSHEVLQLPVPEGTFLLGAFGHLFGGSTPATAATCGPR